MSPVAKAFGFESHPPIPKFDSLSPIHVCSRFSMKSADTIIRSSTRHDLESIERHYGPLDNLGDPFCQPNITQNVLLEWLVIAEIGGEYAGFLYWHLGQKPFFAPEVARFAHMREVQVLGNSKGERGRQKTSRSCYREAEDPCSHRCFSIHN